MNKVKKKYKEHSNFADILQEKRENNHKNELTKSSRNDNSGNSSIFLHVMENLMSTLI